MKGSLMHVGKAAVPEFFGTFWLVFGGTRLAPLAIGLALTLIHLVAISVDNTSGNPARSLAPALFAGDWALSQLRVFIVFPIVGAAMAGVVYRYVLEIPKEQRDRIEGPGEATE